MAVAGRLSVDRLQIVFKVVERCNINCTYCYYFNMGDPTASQRPPTVSIDKASQIANWLAIGCQELQTKELLMSFHGGEPMMLKPETFDSICDLFEAHLGQIVKLYFNMQTNGTILTDKWMVVLRKHRVNVGVSIDGGRVAHDRYRLDHRGRSTFAKTEKTIGILVKEAEIIPEIMPSTISVLNCRNDYSEIYTYLRGLGVQKMSFLLPDRNFDYRFERTGESSRDYGRSLFQIFKAWIVEDNPKVEIRFISEFLWHFRVRTPGREQAVLELPRVDDGAELSTNKKLSRQILIVHSDGLVTVNDSYVPALSWYRNAPQCRIPDGSLQEYLLNGIFDEIEEASRSLSVKCQACKWKGICRGGDLENRYSSKNGFDNPSVYCDGYQSFFEGACNLLIENGYPKVYVERIVAN
jgi:uncharacterized protein